MIVLQIHNRYLIRGGEDESREAEARLLRDRGHRVVEYVEDNVRVAALGNWRAAIRTLWSAESYRSVSDLIRRERPDVTVVHNFFPLVSPSVYYASRRQGVPVIQVLRNYRLFCPAATFFRDGQPCELCLGRLLALPGIRHRCYRNRRSATAVVSLMSALHRACGTWRRQVDRYVALSEFARAMCVKGGLPVGAIHVHPNFVHPDPGIGAGDGGYLLYVGRLSPEKGLGTLLDAWRQVKPSTPLKVVGDGPQAATWQSRTRDWTGLEWLGRRSMAETLSLMGHAAALVFPSACYETFGRVAIEAYAKGTPVIASRLGALEELVEDGRTGFLFSHGDASALAGRLQSFLALPPDARAAMRIAARRRYETLYTADRHYEQLMGLLTAVISQAAGQGDAGS